MHIPQPEWLPTLVRRNDFKSNEDFIEALYERFKTDFIHRTTKYRGSLVTLKRFPMTDTKEEDFWHLMKGKDDTDPEKLNYYRCERMVWARAIIEAVPSEYILEWEERRNGDSRIHLLLDYGPYNYLVVLTKTKRSYILWTGRPVPKNEIDKLHGRYEGAKKISAATSKSGGTLTPSTLR